MRRSASDVIGDQGELYVGSVMAQMDFPPPVHSGGKTTGIDAIYEIVKRHVNTGLFFAVQVKTGPSHIARETRTEYIIKVQRRHTEYWSTFSLPVLLIWYSPTNQNAFWAHVNPGRGLPYKTRISIPKTAKLVANVKGELCRLVGDFVGDSRPLPMLTLPDPPFARISAVKPAAMRFYKQWKLEGCLSPALGRIQISLRGWRHLVAVRRSQREVVERLELLRAARTILDSLDVYHVCRREKSDTLNGRRARTLYLQTAIIRYSRQRQSVVSVVTEQFEDGPKRFISVYEHQNKRKGVPVLSLY